MICEDRRSDSPSDVREGTTLPELREFRSDRRRAAPKSELPLPGRPWRRSGALGALAALVARAPERRALPGHGLVEPYSGTGVESARSKAGLWSGSSGGTFHGAGEWTRTTDLLHLGRAFVGLDRLDEARAAISDALRKQPNLSVTTASAMLHPLHAEYKERFLDSLRKAGLPE